MTAIDPEDPGMVGENLTPTELQEQTELSRRERARIEEENRLLRLENLTRKAGIDPDEGLGKLFMDGYHGEMTAEAVHAAAEGYGLLKTEQPPTGDVTDPNERQQTADRQMTAGGAVPDAGTPSEDPRVVAVREGEEVMAAGGTVEAAMGAAFDRIAAAGYGGEGRAPDPRAQWHPGKEDPSRPDLGW